MRQQPDGTRLWRRTMQSAVQSVDRSDAGRTARPSRAASGDCPANAGRCWPTIQRFGKHDEFAFVGSFEDLDIDLPADPSQAALELWALVATVGIKLEQEWEQPEHCRHQQHAAVAILDIGGMDDGEHQQALGIDQHVTLLALDLFPRIVAMPVVAPPFSALFTLWLSMIAAVGLASRSVLFATHPRRAPGATGRACDHAASAENSGSPCCAAAGP